MSTPELITEASEPDLVRHIAETSITQHLQSYVIDGDPIHIVEAIGECARSGIPPPAPLARALPILASALRRPSRPPTRRSMAILHQVAALQSLPGAGRSPTSNQALRHIAHKYKMTLPAVKQLLQRWRKQFASGAPTRRARALKGLDPLPRKWW